MLSFTDLLSVWLAYVLIFLIGLCVGSFLNVVIYRLPIMMQRAERTYAYEVLEEEVPEQERFDLFKPDSRCPQCGHSIRFWENIPVISYFIQKGLCRGCHKPISKRYPLIELLSGILALVIAWRFQQQAELLLLGLCFTWCLLTLTMIDFDHQILPDTITLPLMWLGIAASALGYLHVPLFASVMGAMLGYLMLWSVYWLFKLITGKEGMGYGDFKLLAALGAWLGFPYLPTILLISALLAIAFALFNRIGRGKAFAYGPFLAMAGWIVFVFNPQIDQLMQSLFLFSA